MTTDRGEFRQLMSDSVLLPPDDPTRRDLARRIGSEENWAAEEWVELERETEVLRSALPLVEVPTDLEQNLLARLDTLAAPPVRRRRWVAVAVAATLMIAIACWWFAVDGVDARSEQVAVLAIRSHASHLTDAPGHRTSDPRALERSLAGELAFAVAVPDFGGRADLLGGRSCRLGPHSVALSTWKATEGPCSLLQFRPADFGLPARMSPRFYHAPGRQPAGCASVWCEDGRAYVLVGTGHRHLQRVLGDRWKN